MDLFRTRTSVVVNGGLDGLASRHRAYANNIANVDTPGFQPSDVPFEAELRQVRDALATDPAAVNNTPRISLQAQTENRGVERADGNGVEVDREVVRMAENSLTYDALTQAARMRGELLRSAIWEGRK